MSGMFEAMEARIADLERRLAALDGSAPVAPIAPGSIRQIVQRVASEYAVPVVELVGPSRKRRIVIARQEAMRRALAEGFTSEQVGRALGGRDHSTVLHGAERARDRLRPAVGPVFASRRRAGDLDERFS